MGTEQAASIRAGAGRSAQTALRPRSEVASLLRGGAPATVRRAPTITRQTAPDGRVMRQSDSHSPSLEDAEHQADGGETLQRTASKPGSDTVQRITGGRQTITCGVHPWRGQAPVGCNIRADTDAGTGVVGWMPDSGVAADSRYWCHGHSLGTFMAHNYSVYSGRNMRQVISDEYTVLGTGVNPRAGDLAVWLPDYDHSAIFTTFVPVGSGAIDENATQLSTKNGMQPLTTKSMTQVRADYPSGSPGWYRR